MFGRFRTGGSFIERKTTRIQLRETSAHQRIQEKKKKKRMRPTTTLASRAVLTHSSSVRVQKKSGIKSVFTLAKATTTTAPCAEEEGDVVSSNTMGRRDTFAVALATTTFLLNQHAPAAFAAYGNAAGSSGDEASGPVTYSTFYGAAEPPATYGKVGGTTPNRAKYSYEVPSTWKEEATSKVEKGSGGQDSRWVPRGVKGVKAVLVTLNRAGEDGQEFSLEDTTINALAGSDPNLQDAILNGLMKTKRSNVDGQDYIQYDIEAGIYYGVKATVDSTGRLFALIISAPDNVYKRERATYERMLGSFRTYILDTTK